MTLTLAISAVAYHIGYCVVEINGVAISDPFNCVAATKTGTLYSSSEIYLLMASCLQSSSKLSNQ